MPAMSLERSNLAQTAALALAALSATALLALVLAYWTWAWFAPRPTARAPAMALPEAGAGVIVAHGLFGTVQSNTSSAAPTGIAARLLGVVAAAGGQSGAQSGGQSGLAIMKLDTRQSVAVREGGELEPGVRLAEVHADHVVLERRGVRETLALPKPVAPAASAASRTSR